MSGWHLKICPCKFFQYLSNSSLFPPGFATITVYQFLLSPECATCLAHLILFDFFTGILFGEQYQLHCSSLCVFLQFPATFYHLDQNITSVTLFSKTLSLWSSLTKRDQVSNPYQVRQRYSSVNFNLCIFRLPPCMKFQLQNNRTFCESSLRFLLCLECLPNITCFNLCTSSSGDVCLKRWKAVHVWCWILYISVVCLFVSFC